MVEPPTASFAAGKPTNMIHNSDIKKIMLVAGEVSGDIHGAKLIEALRKVRPDIETFGVGGGAMAAAGMDLLRNIIDMAAVGFFEAVKNIIPLVMLLGQLKRVIFERRPDVIVLIDYSGFNLKVASMAKKMGVPVVYYFCPQVWAWRKYRAAKVAECVDMVIAVFPFEVSIYRNVGANVVYFGHPVLDELPPVLDPVASLASWGLTGRRPIVTLMPGSRRHEVRSLLPVMSGAAALLKKEFPDIGFALRLAPSVSREEAAALCGPMAESIFFVDHQATGILKASDLVLVASGSATLETAALGVPMVILYRMNPVSWLLGRLFVNLPNVGLANIVSGENVVPELIQWEATERNLAFTALSLLRNPEKRRNISRRLMSAVDRIAKPGVIDKVARTILNLGFRGPATHGDEK